MNATADVAAVSAPIRVRGLRTAYGDMIVHEGLDLEVRAGEILGVVGSSGAGKSVLLNTILGLKRPDGGTIEIFGQNIADPEVQAAIEQRIGVMFQQGALFSALSVQENIEAPFREHADLPADLVQFELPQTNTVATVMLYSRDTPTRPWTPDRPGRRCGS